MASKYKCSQSSTLILYIFDCDHQIGETCCHCLPVTILFCFNAKQGAGSGDDPEKERDNEEKHGALPVVSTSFSLVESCPNLHQEMGAALKRKRQTTTESEITSADALTTTLRDEDELFLLSLLPSLKRLTIKKRMEVRMKFQQVLYAAEFED